MLSVGKEAARTIFKVFAMTQQGFEPPTSQTQTYYATESDINFFFSDFQVFPPRRDNERKVYFQRVIISFGYPLNIIQRTSMMNP